MEFSHKNCSVTESQPVHQPHPSKTNVSELDHQKEEIKIILENSKRPFFVYDRGDNCVMDRIIKIVSSQKAIGLAAVFDEKSAEAGLRNLSYFVVATDCPVMTYVFDCVSLDPIDIFHSLRLTLLSPDVVKVVHNVYTCLGYLYQRHFLELQNVVDLQVVDRTLRRLQPDSDGALASLEDLIQVYVDGSFAWPKRREEAPVEERSWADVHAVDVNFSSTDAAMEGAYLLDIFRAQQQGRIGSLVMRLGPVAREKLAALKGTKKTKGV